MERVVEVSRIKSSTTCLYLDYLDSRTDRTVEIYVTETPELIMAKRTFRDLSQPKEFLLVIRKYRIIPNCSCNRLQI